MYENISSSGPEAEARGGRRENIHTTSTGLLTTIRDHGQRATFTILQQLSTKTFTAVRSTLTLPLPLTLTLTSSDGHRHAQASGALVLATAHQAQRRAYSIWGERSAGTPPGSASNAVHGFGLFGESGAFFTI